MDNGKKNSPKVLTTNDIRKQARDWTLAGDVGLLAHLEQFSENLLNKTQETLNNFNELIDSYEELYTKVGNITNQFLALQNCQFVENRVYDEETPIEEKAEVQEVKDEGQRENLLLMQYKEAVEVGIKILDSHFQEVQLPPNSDSDEEDEYSAGNSIIWKPKNPYASKKFPLLIGSAEWWADDHVGLGTNEESLDTEKIVSESESDMESLKSIEKTIKTSSSSSIENIKSIPKKPTFLESSMEDLFGFDKNVNENEQNTSENVSKGSSSLLEEPASFLPDFEKETVRKTDSQAQEEPKQIDDKPKKIDSAFTRELMAKLASVTNKNEEVKEKPNVAVKIDGDLFDETDDSSDLFSNNVTKIQEKSSGKELFYDSNDNDDELVKGEKDLFLENDLFKTMESQRFDEKKLEPFTAPERLEKKETVGGKMTLANDLFDDLDDDDTLFAAKVVTQKTPEKSRQSMGSEEDIFNSSKLKSAPKLDWENEEGLFGKIDSGVDDDFFNSPGLFDVKANRACESPAVTDSRSEDALFSKDSHVEIKQATDSSIFNSRVENSFEDPFGFSSSKEFTNKKLLDSDEEDDLFSKPLKEEKKPVKVLTLADDNDDEDALFGEKPKLPDSTSISSSRSSLFDDVSASKSRLASVFERDKTSKAEDDLFDNTDDSLFGKKDKIGKDLFTTGREKGSTSLFDDRDDEDDLFGGVKQENGKKIEEKKKVEGFADDLDDDLFKPTKAGETKNEVIIKSDDLDNDELFSDKLSSSKPKPPGSLSLKVRESEAKVKSVGKLNIPDNLKVKFESAAKHISPGGAGGGTKASAEGEKEVLDEPFQGSNLLKCPSRDRVKIPGKRRPQSRRARQEAIRNSGVWDEQTSPSNISNTTQARDLMSSPFASNPLSPSTDEEDFFKVPELDTNFEKEDNSIFKSDLFDSGNNSKLDDNLLPVLSPLSPKKADSLFGSDKKKSIFDDGDENLEDEEESLFKASSKPPREENIGKNDKKIKESLFDLDDEEDDLFGGKVHVIPKPANVEKPKGSAGEKEKGNSSFVDPLGLFTKE